MMRRNLPRSDRVLRSMVRSGTTNLAYQPDTGSRAPLKGSSTKVGIRAPGSNAASAHPRLTSVVLDNSKVVEAKSPMVAVVAGTENESSKDEPQECRVKYDSCRNCKILSAQTECCVCFESIQGSQVKSCPVCANIVCGGCASKLDRCALCRSSLPLESNRALDKFIDGLLLPCRNSKSGCQRMLGGENRLAHESICCHLPLTCPFGRNRCSWQGTVVGIKSHLRIVHNLQPLKAIGLSVKVPSICQKANNVVGRVYSILLDCYDQLFIVRVMTFQGHLRLCFTRLGSEDTQHRIDETKAAHYGVQVVMNAQSGRTVKGLVPFEKYDRERCSDVTVTCDRLYSTSSTTQGCDTRIHPDICQGNLVKIDLQVRKINES